MFPDPPVEPGNQWSVSEPQVFTQILEEPVSHRTDNADWLPSGVTGAQLGVEVEQTIITATQQGGGGGGGRGEADVQGGGAYLHHQQLTAEKAECSVQKPVQHTGTSIWT